jgi:hypothetical protein
MEAELGVGVEVSSKRHCIVEVGSGIGYES